MAHKGLVVICFFLLLSGCGPKQLKDQIQGKWLLQTANGPSEALEFKGNQVSMYLAQVPDPQPGKPSITVEGKQLELYLTHDYKVVEEDLVIDLSKFYGKAHEVRTTTVISEDGDVLTLHHKTAMGLVYPGAYKRIP